MISQDLADSGIEVWDRELMRKRRWAWLRERIEGLLTRPPAAYVQTDDEFAPIWATRVQELMSKEAS